MSLWRKAGLRLLSKTLLLAVKWLLGKTRLRLLEALRLLSKTLLLEARLLCIALLGLLEARLLAVKWLLSIALLLFSCNEVDDFGRVLPESVSLGEVVSVSDLSYEELNELVTDENLREDMRMSGGLLIRPFSDAFSGSFDFMEIHFSDVSSNLPSPSLGDKPMSDTELTGSIPYYENAGLLDYVYLNWDTYEQLFLPGTTLYFELVLGIINYY